MELIDNIIVPLWENIFSLSLKACIPIMVYFLARFILVNKLPPRLLTIFGLIVFIRLIIPLEPEINSSPFSIINIDDYFQTKTWTTQSNNSRDVQSNQNQLTNMTIKPVSIKQSDPTRVEYINPKNISSPSWYIRGIALLWMAGVILIAFKTFTVFLLFTNRYKKTCIPVPIHIQILFEQCQKKVKSNAKLVISNAVRVPCMLGLFRPKIVFPANLINNVSDTEITHIFLHELTHVKRKDIITEIMIQLLCILYWFHPLLKKALAIFKDDRECACDADAIAYLQTEHRISYGKTILRLLTLFSLNQAPECTLGIMDKKQHFKRRLLLITRLHKKTPLVYIIGTIVIIGAALLFTTKAISADDSIKITSTKAILFSTPVARPRISLEYGWTIHPFTKKQRFHNGMDMMMPTGTQITAVTDGKIVKINKDINDDYGMFIIIKHSNGFQSLYSKLSNIVVKENQLVKKGQLVGLSGNTGISTGPHLHFMIFKDDQPVNPREFILF